MEDSAICFHAVYQLLPELCVTHETLAILLIFVVLPLLELFHQSSSLSSNIHDNNGLIHPVRAQEEPYRVLDISSLVEYLYQCIGCFHFFSLAKSKTKKAE